MRSVLFSSPPNNRYEVLSNKIVQVEITDLAFDGKAVGHIDGKVIFLDAGLPGETVVAEIVRSKPRYNQATVREIVRRSDARQPAVCPHFDQCGGCAWQDLAYEQQLFFKKKQVTACIERIGGLESVNVTDVIPCKETFRYRNKMEFSFHVVSEKEFHLGLHRRGRYDEIFDLETCYLQSESANKIVHIVRDFVRQKKISVYDIISHQGFMRFLVIRETRQTGQIMVCLVTNFGDLPQVDVLIDTLVKEVPAITTVVHWQNGKKSNVAMAEKETVLYGPGHIEEVLLDRRFRIAAASFFQTNSRQAEVLYSAAFELLQPSADDRLLDLYCGTGSIGILLAPRVGEVVGVELVPEAVNAAKENARLNGVKNTEFIEANATDFLKSVTQTGEHYDVVVVDPPRAGLHPKALKHLIELNPEKLLYISCNPATFARDAGLLAAAGYTMSDVKPVDMFPHTKHIELSCLFSH